MFVELCQEDISIATDKVRATARRIGGLHQRFANGFGCKEAKAYSIVDLRGLMLAEGRKNVEAMALQFAKSTDDGCVGQNEVLILQNYRYLSTSQLLRRIQNPSTGLISIRSQMLFFHKRLVRSLISLIAVIIVVRLILPCKSRSLGANTAVCALVMGMLYGVKYLFGYLGQVNIITPDLVAGDFLRIVRRLDLRFRPGVSGVGTCGTGCVRVGARLGVALRLTKSNLCLGNHDKSTRQLIFVSVKKFFNRVNL
ncbi:MAG: hypothetical protein IID45_05035 [Planctomycetes bacterium]|nr:hypothetical protein [Planctomycetota bacterium]